MVSEDSIIVRSIQFVCMASENSMNVRFAQFYLLQQENTECATEKSAVRAKTLPFRKVASELGLEYFQ